MELLRTPTTLMELKSPVQPVHPIMKVDYQRLFLGEKAPEIVNAYVEVSSIRCIVINVDKVYLWIPESVYLRSRYWIVTFNSSTCLICVLSG